MNSPFKLLCFSIRRAFFQRNNLKSFIEHDPGSTKNIYFQVIIFFSIVQDRVFAGREFGCGGRRPQDSRHFPQEKTKLMIICDPENLRF